MLSAPTCRQARSGPYSGLTPTKHRRGSSDFQARRSPSDVPPSQPSELRCDLPLSGGSWKARGIHSSPAWVLAYWQSVKVNPCPPLTATTKGPLEQIKVPSWANIRAATFTLTLTWLATASPSAFTLSHDTGTLTFVPIGSAMAMLKSCGWFTTMLSTLSSAVTFKRQMAPGFCALASKGPPSDHSILRLKVVSTRIHLPRLLPMCFPMV